MTLLVVTDLDGSLMEHETYSIDAARPALENLRKRGFLVVMNSSKTKAEIESLQAELDMPAPFICENGASLTQLDSTLKNTGHIDFGEPLGEWLPVVHELRRTERYQFEGFSDWNAKQVSNQTGLTVQAAELAKQRQFSEPIQWNDTPTTLSRFQKQLNAMGLQLIEGGRFHSIQGKHDKSDAMRWLHTHLHTKDKLITVALGDSPNDRAMLNAADVAVIIKSAKSEQIELKNPQRVIRTKQSGPAGWQDAIDEILDLLDNNLLLTN